MAVSIAKISDPSKRRLRDTETVLNGAIRIAELTYAQDAPFGLKTDVCDQSASI